MAKLDKFRGATFDKETAKWQLPAATETNDVNDTADPNDTASIVSLMSIINATGELANEKQKTELLSDSFVKQVFTEAISKATEFESKGKWLDAYITCYSWLSAIDKDNLAYSDYAKQLEEKADIVTSFQDYTEQLTEKAGIVASFQDSTCETSRERYAGVEKEMFIWAVSVLKAGYVNKTKDHHREMAIKAVKRCQLLGQVVELSFSEISESWMAGSPNEPAESSFSRPDSEKIKAWSAALEAISYQLNSSAGRLSERKFIGIFKKVLTLNEKTLKLPGTVVIAQFAESAFSALDPYTVVVWPKQVRDFDESLTGEFTGIGIRISKPKGKLTAVSLLPDTPAYRSGLDAGDIIEKVDGVDTNDMTLNCAKKAITGPKGTDVTLTINRPGQDKTRDITITRGRIIVPTVRGWQRTAAAGAREAAAAGMREVSSGPPCVLSCAFSRISHSCQHNSWINLQSSEAAPVHGADGRMKE